MRPLEVFCREDAISLGRLSLVNIKWPDVIPIHIHIWNAHWSSLKDSPEIMVIWILPFINVWKTQSVGL